MAPSGSTAPAGWSTLKLAADIVATSFAPTWDELGRLVVVAVVRTFPSHFLDREIKHAAR